MTQAASILVPTAGPKSPQAMAAAMNDAIGALLTLNAGAGRPSYAATGMPWIDTTTSPWLFNVYDGTQDILIGIIDPTTHAFTPIIRQLEAEQSLASAATTDLASKPTSRIVITGTTQISSFGAGVNLLRFVRMAGALTLKNSSALVLPGATDIVTAVGDTLIAMSDAAANWHVIYQKADGTAVIPPALATAADIQAATAAKIVSASAVLAAMAWGALTPSSTVAIDHGGGVNRTLTPAQNFTFGAPTNPRIGYPLNIAVKQPLSGGPYTGSYNAVFDFGANAVPVLSTTANTEDLLCFVCRSASSFAFLGIIKGF